MMRRSILAIVLILALAAIIALAIPRSRPTPSTPEGAPRIASLSPALTVILRDLGLSDRIVARHSWDMVLDRRIPIGLDREFDYEQLLLAKPTHILLQLQSQETPSRLTQLAAANHWNVLDFPILTLDDIRTTTTRLASIFATGADQVLLKEMDRAWSPRPVTYKGRVLLLAALDPPSALGPGSWHHQLLERLGGIPAITTGTPYITLDAEDILHMKPDGIILVLPRDPSAAHSTPTPDELRRQLGRVGTLDIPAISSARIALIDHPLAHTPSTAMIQVADDLAAILERWAR